ncbi:MAG: hypothetical protein ACFE0Q_20770 [Anaerolineae bacterium]
MVMWWHPRTRLIYTLSVRMALVWYGRDYLDYAVICEPTFEASEWVIWREVVE